MKTCATCNAPETNSILRIIRCGTCVATQNGNSKWQPMKLSPGDTAQEGGTS